MENKRGLYALGVIASISSVFIDTNDKRLLLFSIVFIITGTGLCFATKNWSLRKFLFSIISFLAVGILTFFYLSEMQNNINLQVVLKNGAKWKWIVNNHEYSIQIKNDSAYFYDSADLIDKYHFVIKGKSVDFKSTEEEEFTMEFVRVLNNQLVVVDGRDTIFLIKK